MKIADIQMKCRESDLASDNHDRWAEAICKCIGGDPTACIVAQACVNGQCFKEPNPKNADELEREIEQLRKRNDELNAVLNQFCALLEKHSKSYEQTYDRMLKLGKDSAFIYKAVLNETKHFKTLIDGVYKA